MPEQNSSFIPKSGVKTVQRASGSRRIYLLAYISYVIFFSTLFVVIGVYIYGATVDRSFSKIQEQLIAERQRFAVSDIDNVKQLAKRISTANMLLSESTAPSRIFSDIERIVASNIYFSAFSYKHLPNRQFEIELEGRASDFNQVIGQEQLIKSGSILSNAVVVDYDYNVGEGQNSLLGDATLSFLFSDTRDLSAIAYIPNVVESTDFSSEMGGGENNVIGSPSGTSPSMDIEEFDESVPVGGELGNPTDS